MKYLVRLKYIILSRIADTFKTPPSFLKLFCFHESFTITQKLKDLKADSMMQVQHKCGQVLSII
jgi:hypothetical protein